MNTKLVNSAAGVVLAAMEQDRTAAGIALALDSAQMLMSPEMAAELERFHGLELGDTDGRVSAACGDPEHPTWLRAKDDTRRCPWCRAAELEADLAAKGQDAEAAVAGWGRARNRIAELEALTPARHQTCRVCGAGFVFGEPCAQCEFRARMAAESQARVRQPYRVGHDLPELGGQR